MSKAYKCDRCKKFYENPGNRPLELVKHQRDLDLCNICYAQLTDWLEGNLKDAIESEYFDNLEEKR